MENTKEIKNEAPKLMTIRQVAETGILSEYTLRLLHKQGKLPCIELPRKILVNYTALVEQLNKLEGKF